VPLPSRALQPRYKGYLWEPVQHKHSLPCFLTRFPTLHALLQTQSLHPTLDKSFPGQLQVPSCSTLAETLLAPCTLSPCSLADPEESIQSSAKGWQCVSSPARDKYNSKMTHAPGTGKDNHTYQSNCGPRSGIGHTSGLTAGLAHQQKLLSGNKEKVSCRSVLPQLWQTPGLTQLKPKEAQTVPLTPQGPNPAHNRKRAIADDWTEGKCGSATTVG